MDLFLQLPMLPAVTLHMFGVARTPEGKFTQQTSPTCHFGREDVSQRSRKDPVDFFSYKGHDVSGSMEPSVPLIILQVLVNFWVNNVNTKSSTLPRLLRFFPCFWSIYALCQALGSKSNNLGPRWFARASRIQIRIKLSGIHKMFFCTQSSACHLILRQSA